MNSNDIENVKDGENPEWVQIECTYDSRIFYNPSNKYCIVKMVTSDITVPIEARDNRIYPDDQIRFTAVGYELPFTDAVKLVLEGVWEKGKYGMQLQVEQWKEVIPETESGVYNYLSSGLLKGIELTKDIKGVKTIFFRNEDIVRHPLVAKIVKAFEKGETV